MEDSKRLKKKFNVLMGVMLITSVGLGVGIFFGIVAMFDIPNSQLVLSPQEASHDSPFTLLFGKIFGAVVVVVVVYVLIFKELLINPVLKKLGETEEK